MMHFKGTRQVDLTGPEVFALRLARDQSRTLNQSGACIFPLTRSHEAPGKPRQGILQHLQNRLDLERVMAYRSVYAFTKRDRGSVSRVRNEALGERTRSTKSRSTDMRHDDEVPVSRLTDTGRRSHAGGALTVACVATARLGN